MQRQIKSLWWKTILSVVAIGFLLALGMVNSRAYEIHAFREQRPLMGTNWTVEVVDEGRPEAARHAVDAAYLELERIDRLMSEWKPQSPVSQINAAAGRHAVEVPEELRALLQRSIRYSTLTQGTFDITWHGMAKIWHFDESFVAPTEAQVAEAKKNVNYREIQIDGNRVFLPRAGMSIGLGGIAKGYAIDRASAVLAKAGFNNTLVDGGGDVLVSGTKKGEPWRLGVQDPRKERGEIIGSIALTSGALVSSGDYERFRMVNGKRYHHIIDPRTGWPATEAISVTVIAPTAEEAVVLGKGIYMLGPEQGMALARSSGVEALLVDPQGKQYETDGFRKRLEVVQ